MKKIEIIHTDSLEKEISEIVILYSYGDDVTKEEDVILKVLELYTSRYKNMLKCSLNATENAIRQK